MASKLDDIIARFALADDDEVKLALLLDYAKKLPPLPPAYQAKRQSDDARVHECMTPVWLWIERDNGSLRMHTYVGEEAPTVKGFLSILLHAYDGSPPQDAADAPADLVNRLGLQNQIRMNRLVGIGAMIDRVRKAAAALTT